MSDLDFFTLLPPVAGCLPFKDDTDTTTSVETPSCSVHGKVFLATLNIGAIKYDKNKQQSQ